MKHRRRIGWNLELLQMSIPKHLRKIQVSIRYFSPGTKYGMLPEGKRCPLAANALPNALPPPLMQPLRSMLFMDSAPSQAVMRSSTEAADRVPLPVM
jgi:hypothetical protein